MVSIRYASAIVAATLFSRASAQSWVTGSVEQIPTPTATVRASALTTVGCFNTGIPLADHGRGDFASDGACQQICLGLDQPVLGLSDGENCWCGELVPPEEAKVPIEECNTSCSGFPEKDCGGPGKLLIILTGKSRNAIPFYEPKKEEVSSAAPSPSSKKPDAVSHTSAPAQTVVQTATTAPLPSATPTNSKPNTVGIAVGVVVGVLALLAIVGGVFFFLRQKKRRAVEEEYRRQAAVNSFVSGGKLHTSTSSMTDSRLDPEFMNRRASNGSIADNEDYSRRILKVTNA
ncbi:hypothetical protein BDV95DRAFT_607233 [Massariosphaeria phaeospora]|uniref:WSC domain-containing protein n=1 Tax=Massariosphaeria phaeospora TaxID=100035 RepID=A0A7C8M5C2_9PLEO|nr:hypothetical protein BDV95DRAFT_607233 [Massariosphaeria phaeospora]